ncbi:MAG: RNA-binding transcriptional accessory protein [Clostridiales bacterium]|nr:RNA-binding transcriptional accessory protein [Clostridiales bacterium]
MEIKQQLTEEFHLRPDHAENILKLLDEGNTIPFIARYRKEMTGAIDDQVLREFNDRYEYLKNLNKRKQEVENAITEQGKMTEEIQAAIDAAQTMTEVEDIYRPYKQKKKTRASVAIEKGLQPLAEFILEQESDPYKEAEKYIDEEKGVSTVEEAINGAKDIIAEIISDNAELRKKLRSMLENHGEMQVKMVKDDEKGTYAMYADYAEIIPEIKNHRVLAINRGEKEECLKAKIYFNPDIAKRICMAKYIKAKGQADCIKLIEEAADDGYDRLIEPSVEREVRAILTDKASEQAIKMFEVNLRPLLLQPPVKGKITLGLDPGYRTGCKVAVVDETGKVLDTSVIYPVPPKNDIEGAKKIIKNLIAKHKVDIISIGNGTASKETEIFVADLLKELGDDSVSYAVVSEAGASVYSASKLAVEEFPDFDVTQRSAVSIARRLQDPLAELIKIDPKSIGVGQYQHDMDAKRLDSVLGGVLEDCVNSVGVDLNTASVSLLKYVAGLNAGIAKNIVTFREENGKFTSRAQLLKVSKLGPKAYEQCAGFLRIPDGKNILDNTAVHPESYKKAEKLLELFGYSEEDVKARKLSDLPQKVKDFGEAKAAEHCELDKATMNDIIAELVKPGRDIRDSLPQRKLRKDILGIEDLAVGMEVEGTVRNVIDFGAFVDIGVHEDGLVHISEITDRFIKHPSDVLKVGQQVKAVIISLDKAKHRIGLSLKQVKKQAN